jgi:hypothetical protein
MKWISRLSQQGHQGRRLAGPPTSSNGASSFHLWWVLPVPGPFRQVRAVLEVVRPPAVARLYFWALQASFVERGRELGAGHTGLQWHPGAPSGAVNWGGYHSDGRGVLDGTGSQLEPVDGPHTRHYPWAAGRRYGFRVWSPAPGAWRSEVADLGTGQATVVRDLFVPASALANPVVWSEVFAHCDDPPTEARWSSLQAVSTSGDVVTARSVRLTYQAHADGGCANTETTAEGGCFVQFTGMTEARAPAPDILSLDA